MRRPLLRTSASAAGAVLLSGLLAGCGPEQPWESRALSTDAAGTDMANDHSWQPVFTPDGTKVAFQSWATNLPAADDPANTAADLFLRDLATGEMTLITAAADGDGGGNGASARPFFSDDGTKVVFQSMATNLGPPDPDTPERGEDIYLRDLATGEVQMLTPDVVRRDEGFDAEIGGITPDAGLVLFESTSANLVAVDGNDSEDVFVRDVAAGTTTLVSTNAAGTDSANGTSADPVLSPDGTKVAFHSTAANLDTTGATDANGTWDVYVADLTTGTTTLVTTGDDGAGSGDGESFVEGFGPDSRHVLVQTTAGNLGPTDSNDTNDLYLYDLDAPGEPTLVSANAAGTDSGNGSSIRGQLSPDGSAVAFYSLSDDLGPTDNPHCIVRWRPPAPPELGPCPDIYLRDLTTGTTTLVTADEDGTDSAERSTSGFPRFSPDGTRIVFESQSSFLGPQDGNRATDIYVRDLVAETTTLVSRRAGGDATGSAAGGSGLPSFSPDGRHVVYDSGATDLTEVADTNDRLDVFVATPVAADVALALRAAPEPVGTGDEVVYTAHVANDGPDPARATQLRILLPEGTTYVGVDGDGDCTPPSSAEPRLVECALGDLAEGGAGDVEVTATVHAAGGSTLRALATADAVTADTDRTDNTSAADSTVD
jgi:uncharacterized repeat protein (TIGR01451 family)